MLRQKSGGVGNAVFKVGRFDAEILKRGLDFAIDFLIFFKRKK
jgi:hypothetical protein